MRWIGICAIALGLACNGDESEDSASAPSSRPQTGTDTNTEGGDSAESPGDSGDSGDSGTPTSDPEAEAAEAITDAAQAFLSSLSKEAQTSMHFSMDDPARKTWSNLPISMYEREGILTGDLDATQLELAYSMLEASLSSQGYIQALNIIAVDQWHRDNGDEMMGDQLYSISIFGEPSTTEAWSWQLDGHHLCYTFTINVDQVSMSPALWGVNPLTIPDGDLEGLRAMGDEVDAGFMLLDSFNEAQKAIAVLHPTMSPGILGGPGGDDFEILDTELGLSAADMSPEQQALLLELAQTFILDMEDTHAALRLAEVEAGVDDLYFAWMGPTDFGSEIYYRIYGPTVLIELDHVNGNDHIHSVYRNPGNDYGENILAAHYARYPH